MAEWFDDASGMVGAYVAPSAPVDSACVVVGGSGGGLGVSKAVAEGLAAEGIASLAVAYHGTEVVRPTMRDVPLEGFATAARWLSEAAAVDVSGVALLGISRGSEAVMLVGAMFDDLTGPVIGVVPGNVVACSFPPGHAAWLLRGAPLPYVSSAGPDCADPDALIPVERIGSLLLVSAGRDEIWPSGPMAEAIVARRQGHGRPTEHVHLPDAGHTDAIRGGWPTIIDFVRRRGESAAAPRE